MMIQNGYKVSAKNMNNGMQDSKPTYAVEHLATFKVKHETEVRNPKEKLKVLKELDDSGAIWPQQMYLSFSGIWLVMLDDEMNEIENFPGSLIKEPTAFNSEDPLEAFNNILAFTVTGVSLGTTEMHFFQVAGTSAIFLVEDLKQLNTGNVITIDRNPLFHKEFQKLSQTSDDEFKNAINANSFFEEKDPFEKNGNDIQVLNHCFEDIERFVARLQYAAEALSELHLRQNEHSSHGEGLLILRSRPPIESEFHDILAKLKLAINYVVKLNNIFSDGTEPISNLFISLQTIVSVCNEVHGFANIPKNVVNPLLNCKAINFLSDCLSGTNMDLWSTLGTNWTMAKEHFQDHGESYHPIFYDDWSPDWVVDEEVPYVPISKTKSLEVQKTISNNAIWLSHLKSKNVKIAKVTHNVEANNDSELKVIKGEYLEVIDDSRNWWEVRNSSGYIGYTPCTILEANNFNAHSRFSTRDADSTTTNLLEQDQRNNNNNDSFLCTDTYGKHVPSPSSAGKAMSRSYSMPNVPIPPPMPPSENQEAKSSGTTKRNMAAAVSESDGLLKLQGSINEELRAKLYLRERRKDLEILTTPNIYITQYSSPKEVQEWLRAKGFSEAIREKLCKLNGEELFKLSLQDIEEYFGQNESRRLVSQIVLQKNICEYKTIRSSELSAKLAKARQKADQAGNSSFEIV